MSGAIPPLPSMPPWRGAQLKHRDNFTFTFYTPVVIIICVVEAASLTFIVQI